VVFSKEIVESLKWAASILNVPVYISSQNSKHALTVTGSGKVASFKVKDGEETNLNMFKVVPLSDGRVIIKSL